jgi:hypothetical protein
MAADTKIAIENALKPLLGLPLSGAGHAGDMRIFSFGELRPSRRGNGLVGAYAVHIQCSWRLTDGDQLVTGYFDYHIGADGESEPDRGDARRGNRQQVRLEAFFGDYDETRHILVDRSGRFVVTSIEADRYGSVDIGLNGGEACLRILSDSSAMEHWRFFSTELEDSPHFVVTGGEIEEVD